MTHVLKAPQRFFCCPKINLHKKNLEIMSSMPVGYQFNMMIRNIEKIAEKKLIKRLH